MLPSFEIYNVHSRSDVLLLCDHASNHVPPEIGGGSLGLPQSDMDRHIAFDVGAAEVTRGLADALGASAVLSGVSRLVIDPNRGADDPTLVMQLYDRSIIAGNRGITGAEIARRKKLYYDPYHRAIEERTAALTGEGLVPHLISIHSFTPQLAGKSPRPWHVGILWDRDERLSAPLITALEAEGDLCVGDNQPYSGQLRGDCLYRHGTLTGYPHVLIEIRNDLIAEPEGQAAWVARLARLLPPLIPVATTRETPHG